MSPFRTLLLCACFLLFVSSTHAQSGSSVSPHQLEGLWGTEQILTPMVGGELVIDGREGAWIASIGGFRATVARDGDQVHFALEGGRGQFRGRISGRQIRGHWIQSASIPPYSQRYASPVELHRSAANVWRGLVRPLEYRMSLYLNIENGPDGAPSAFVRNPEANFFAGRRFGVRTSGQNIELMHPDVPESGIFRGDSNAIESPLLYLYPPLALTRRSNRDGIGFYPRVGHSGDYAYRPPLSEADGWAISTLAEENIDTAAIERFVNMIIDAQPGPNNPLNIHSLLIARHGRLVLDEYFYGFDRNREHDMRSASKTIAPILVGVARDRGVSIDSDTSLYSLFPEFASQANWDERKRAITVADLMNMASGLAIDDADPQSPGNESRVNGQVGEPDWCRYTLDLPRVRDPGGDNPVYGSANTNLVGCALTRATGRWLPDLFDEYLARPLQIPSYYINLMPNGEAYSGGGWYLRPRDQLKLGQVYLADGMWNGRRIVSREWVARSTVRHGDMRPRMEIDVAHGYGYGWHFRECTVNGRRLQYYWMGGNGGQYVIVVPELDLVVGFTGGDIAEFRKYLPWEIEFLPRYILSAVR